MSRIYDFLDVLEKLRKDSISLGIPAIDPEDGMILASTAFSTRPREEVYIDAGAGIGYSTLWIALGVEPSCSGKCRVIAIEYDEGLAERLEANLTSLEDLFNSVSFEVIKGDALEVLSHHLENTVGYVFVDVEKRDYPRMLDILEETLEPGGLALFHNAFVPRPPEEFFEKIGRRPWRSVIVPTKAGLALVRKEAV